MKRSYLFVFVLAFFLLLPGLASAQSEILTINGYSSFEFEKMLSDEGKGDPNGSFDVDLFDIVINVRPSKNVRVAADVTWEHGAATEDGRGNVAVEYAFAEYFVGDWLQLRGGKMFTAFGIYNEIHTAKPAFLTVKEPLSTNKNNKFGSLLRFYPRWGAGLAALGDGQVAGRDLDYVVQLTNGEQEITNPFEEDNNVYKAVTARARYQLADNLLIAGSFYTDRLTDMSVDEDLGFDQARVTSYGGHLVWTPGQFGLEFEYVGGNVSPTGLDKVNRHAISALVSYTLAERYTPYLRYEYLEPDTRMDDDQAAQFIYGLNIRLARVLFLKAELNTVTSGDANIRFKGVGYTEFTAAAVVGF